MCTRARYRTPASAQRAIDNGYVLADPGWRLEVHSCAFCGGWHIDQTFDGARMSTADRSCWRKSRYATEDQARRMAARCMDARGEPLRSYACHECGGWHLTSKPIE